MLRLPKYAHYLLFSMLLLSLGNGIFKHSIYEVLHALSHVNEWFTQGKGYHTFHDHDTEHHHVVLSQMEDQQGDEDKGVLDKEHNKKLDIVKVEIQSLFINENKTSRTFSYLFYFQHVFRSIDIPPQRIA